MTVRQPQELMRIAAIVPFTVIRHEVIPASDEGEFALNRSYAEGCEGYCRLEPFSALNDQRGPKQSVAGEETMWSLTPRATPNSTSRICRNWPQQTATSRGAPPT
jgi:hypothetical protein